MQFVPKLETGVLVRRYKRFFADMETPQGALITAHCVNTGPMTGLLEPGGEVAFSHNPSKHRKLHYTWEMVFVENTWVGTNTHRPNVLVREAFHGGKIPALSEYSTLRSEVSVGSSRLDFYATKNHVDQDAPFADAENAYPTASNLVSLSQENQEKGVYIEVKNVHSRRENRAFFPDTVTTRGTKHLRSLTTLVQEGYEAMMIYVIQRGDCQTFEVAGDLDPDYARAFQEARQAGVKMLAYACDVSPQGITLEKNIPLEDTP